MPNINNTNESAAAAVAPAKIAPQETALAAECNSRGVCSFAVGRTNGFAEPSLLNGGADDMVNPWKKGEKGGADVVMVRDLAIFVCRPPYGAHRNGVLYS